MLFIQVDIFSLGITLYELMTLQLLPPPEVNSLEFDSDIREGIRPRFIEVCIQLVNIYILYANTYTAMVRILYNLILPWLMGLK